MPTKLNNGFPQPLKARCFQCQQSFFIKFVISRQQYSQKNNWEYWTKNKADQGQRICNHCLRTTYQDKFIYWAAVKDAKKRALLRVYLHSGQI